MEPKERNDRLEEILPPIDYELAEVLAVVIVPPVDEDPSYAEEAFELLQAGSAPLALRHANLCDT